MSGWLLAAVTATAAGLLSVALTRRDRFGTAQSWTAGITACAVTVWATLTVEPLAWLGYLAFAVVWGTATAVDLAEHDLPDQLTLVPVPLFFLLQVPWAVVEGTAHHYVSALLGMLATGAVLFVLALINPRGFGLGDVKLGLATGSALGWLGFSEAMLGVASAFILMAFVSATLLATRCITRESEVPFGPFMVLGVLVAPAVVSLLGW